MRDKVIVITGASGGIGAALAHAVAQRGANVVLVARREEARRDVARACGERAHPVVADVTRREEVAAVVAGVIETRRPDVYTRSGARERIAAFYAGVGEDP